MVGAVAIMPERSAMILPMAADIPGVVDLEVVGRGGFSTVYRGREVAFDREVAVKVLVVHVASDGERARFERECRAHGSLANHPNVVTLHGAGLTDDDVPYLVLPFLPGGSLADRLAVGPRPLGEVLGIGTQIAGALEYAHARGIVHRDVKPANILFDEFDTPLLADFGISQMQGAFETRSGQMSASVAYAAPEVFAGEPATASGDVYSLAATLYAAICGAPAFYREGEDNLLALMVRVAHDPVPDLRQQGVPDPVAEVLEQGLAKDPAARFASSAAFAAAIQAAASELGLAVPAPRLSAAPAVPPTFREAESVDHGSPTPRADDGSAAVDAAAAPVRGDNSIVTGRLDPALLVRGADATALPGGEATDGGTEDRNRSRKVLWLSLAAAMLTLALIASLVATSGRGGTGLAAGSATPVTPTSENNPSDDAVLEGLPVTLAPGIESTRTSTLAAPDGDEVDVVLTFSNAGSDPARVEHLEVIPKELAPSVEDITFATSGDGFTTEVVEADPVLRFTADLPAGGSVALTYEVSVEPGEVTEERLVGWQDDRVAAEGAYLTANALLFGLTTVIIDGPDGEVSVLVPQSTTTTSTTRTTGTTGATGDGGGSATTERTDRTDPTVEDTKPTTSTVPIVKPGEPKNLVVSNPRPAPTLRCFDLPTDVTVTLTWDPPSDTGGEPLSGYVIEIQLVTGSGTFSATPSPVAVAGTDRTATIKVPRRNENGYFTYSIRAKNSAGEGPSTPATGLMPDMVGKPYYELYATVRAVGGMVNLDLYGPQVECPFIESQSSSVNATIHPGTLITFRVQNPF